MPSFIFAVVLIPSWITAEHFLPWVSWHNELWAFLAAILVATTTLISCKRQKAKTISAPSLIWIGVLFLGVVLVQYMLGHIIFFGNALVLAFYVCVCLFALVAGHHAAAPCRQVRPKDQAVDHLAIVVMLGAVGSAVVALVQGLGVWEEVSWITPMPSTRRPGGNLGQPNQLGTLLLMGLASLVYLFEAGRLRIASTLALYFLLICGLAVTESRTALLSFLLMIVWWMARYRTVGSRVEPLAVLVGSAAMLAMFWFWPQFSAYIGLVDGELARVNTSAGTRLIVWPQLMEAALQRPWFGWGLGEVAKAHNAVLHDFSVSEPFTYAHNIVLDLAVGMGLPLTALFVVTTAVWLWRRVRATRGLLPWYCLALMLPFGVHSMLEFPFAYAYFLLPVMFAVGILEGVLAPQSYVRIGWWPAAGGSVLVVALMAWSVVEYIFIEEDFRVARFEATHIGQTPNEYERPKVYLLTQLDALLRGARIVPAPGMSSQVLELSLQVATHFPSIATQNSYALTLALNGDSFEAVRQLRVLRAQYGEKKYVQIKAKWLSLADDKYPELHKLNLP